MGQIMGPQFALAGGFVTAFVALEAGAPGPLAWLLAAVVAVLCGLAWWYSPLPHQNGGWGHPPARRQQWGFTTEPADDSPEPIAGEALSWRPNWLGIYTTDRQPEDGDSDG